MYGKKNYQGTNDPPKHVEEYNFNESGASQLGLLRLGSVWVSQPAFRKF